MDSSLVGNDHKIFNQHIISVIGSVETQSHSKMDELLMDGRYRIEITDTAVGPEKANVVSATHYYR